ncbi:MAG TPA: DUF4998 domain-containing protein [Chitinophagaceae bacterium]|nr:DUF4998 domain-containing protein [Chitinophagaceae bacterium]
MILFIISGAFSGCKKMDSTYRKYVVQGGLTYTGKVTSATAYPGHNRVKISWLRGSDINVTHVRIFWNNYTDSIEVHIPSTGDTISAVIGNLPEKSYSFILETYDDKGHSSVKVELLSAAYGDSYESSLLNRPVFSSIMGNNDTVNIQWGSADISNGAYATEIQYTDTAGDAQVRRFDISDPGSQLTGYKPGTTFSYRTVYLPDSLSIDTFYTDYATQHVSGKIDKSNWIATADSYTPTRLLPSGPPDRAIDGDINTYWHSLYPSNVVFPHWLEVDMGQAITVTGVELIYRQNVFNDFANFNIEGSMDGINWTTYGSFTFLKVNDPQDYAITGAPQMRYIRVYADKGVNNYAHLGEFSVFGY